MVVHHCFRCSYSSTRKTLWRGHLQRDRLCEIKYLDIPRELILTKYHEYLNDYLKIKKESELLKCNNCSFKTKHPRSLRRHIKTKVCGRKKKLSELLEEVITHSDNINITTSNSTDAIEEEPTLRVRIARDKISKDKRLALLQQTNNCCGICNTHIIANVFDVDHLVPVSAGGNNSDLNLLPMCPSCHCFKTRRIDKMIKLLDVPNFNSQADRDNLIKFIRQTIDYTRTLTAVRHPEQT